MTIFVLLCIVALAVAGGSKHPVKPMSGHGRGGGVVSPPTPPHSGR